MGRSIWSARSALKPGQFSSLAKSGELSLAKRTLEMWSVIGQVLGELDVAQVSKPTHRPTLYRPSNPLRPADCEIGDTAGLETCATVPAPTFANNGSQLLANHSSQSSAHHSSQQSPNTSPNTCAQPTIPPLTKGEGRGEGEPGHGKPWVDQPQTAALANYSSQSSAGPYIEASCQKWADATARCLWRANWRQSINLSPASKKNQPRKSAKRSASNPRNFHAAWNARQYTHPTKNYEPHNSSRK